MMKTRCLAARVVSGALVAVGLAASAAAVGAVEKSPKKAGLPSGDLFFTMRGQPFALERTFPGVTAVLLLSRDMLQQEFTAAKGSEQRMAEWQKKYREQVTQTFAQKLNFFLSLEQQTAMKEAAAAQQAAERKPKKK